jgi:hypothetical protein
MLRTISVVLAGCASTLGGPAVAQDLIAEYFASISPQDMYNSSGERLRDWCAMIQQDRANYHRFGLRDDSDQGDPIFASRAARAAIAGNCQVAPGSEYVAARLQNGSGNYVWVRVYGYGDRPLVVVVSEGAG